MAGTRDNRARNKTEQGKNKRYNTIKITDNTERVEIISRSNTIYCKCYTQTSKKNRPNETTTAEKNHNGTGLKEKKMVSLR